MILTRSLSQSSFASCPTNSASNSDMALFALASALRSIDGMEKTTLFSTIEELTPKIQKCNLLWAKNIFNLFKKSDGDLYSAIMSAELKDIIEQLPGDIQKPWIS